MQKIMFIHIIIVQLIIPIIAGNRLAWIISRHDKLTNTIEFLICCMLYIILFPPRWKSAYLKYER